MELQRLIEKDLFAGRSTAYAGDSEIITLNYMDRLSVHAVYDVQTPSAKTFDSGAAADLTDQSITYTANERGEAGNDITITLVDPGEDSALIIDVTGTDIVVTLAYATGAVTTDADALVAAINLDVAASALITATGTGNTPLNALVETPLAGGTESEVNLTDDTLTIPSHGFPQGFKVRLTTTGTLPDPLLTATDYFVIVVDDDTIQLAASFADSEAGTAITLVDQGSDGAVNTATGVALAGASIGYYASNFDEGDDWFLIQTATSITVDGSSYFPPFATAQPPFAFRRFKCVKGLTAGAVDLKAQVLVIGGTN